VRFGVLGPLVAEDGDGPVHLGGARHRAIVARLLLARGRVVPVSRLIADLWTDPPAGALGAVQTFVGELRRVLEPGRAPRTPARVLVTAAPGYALRAGPDDVDAWAFETAVTRSAELLARTEPARARDLLDDALARWRGPAYAEFAEEDWARAEAARLEELRLLAIARRAEAALALGAAAELVPDLEAAVADHPLREDGWRLLALALYRSGRQGDALAALRRARQVLREELGVDPSPVLQQLERDVLGQAPLLSTPVVAAARPGEPFVGRGAELAAVERAAATVAASRRPGLVLLSGPAGVGKSTLARAAAGRLAAGGWTVATGVSPEAQSAPSAQPWAQLQVGLAAGRPIPTVPAHGDPATARFARHRAIAAQLAAISADGPVLLVFDDLHWADEETLALLTALATDPDAGAVLVIGTHRTTDVSPALTEALARLARTEPTRLELPGLSEPDVVELVTALTDGAAAEDDARTIAARSAGNPFFVRELTRLWEAEGRAVLHRVPAGVRDVVRHRLSTLPEPARAHLRLAAVLGDDVDLDVLVPLVGGNEEAVLASIESALLAGFLMEQDADRLRFAHALVRETLYADVPQARRARWHAATADVLEALRPDDVAAIAEHLVRAGSRVAAPRTAHWTRAAAERAEGRAALHEAARLWGATLTALDRADPDPRARLDAAMGLVRTLAVTGDLARARDHRAAAVAAAEALGDPLLTARVLGSFDVPAVWTANDDEALSARLVATAERTLAVLPAGADAERARLLTTVALERRADAGPRGREAAEEAAAIARSLGDPALLALALNGRFLQTFSRAGLAPERARLGEELLAVAGPAGLVTFEVLGHLVLIQSAAALADLSAADGHAAAADALADRYDLPVVGVFTDWYAALRLAVTGEREQAETAYRAAARRLTGTGMRGMEGLLPLALLCLAPGSPPTGADWGPYAPWARPLVLLAEGRPDGARTALREVPDSPHDLLFEARSCLAAIAAVRLGDRDRMARLYDQLLPAADELAGAGSGLLTLGPVARHLGELAAGLGHPSAEHVEQARAVAGRAALG
jgi:DNA-binding SARP family transcriptional activator